jgi:predicted DNA-binding antitoxin AbrB/MazE fold protein
LVRAIKAKYKDGVIKPLKKLDIPDDTDLTIIIKMSDEPKKAKKREWYEWRGILKGTTALQDHEREHREEIEREKSL